MSLVGALRAFGISVIVLLQAGDALADQHWAALGWVCDEQMTQLTIFPVRFDANTTVSVSREGLYVPMAEGWDNPSQSIEVTTCTISRDRVLQLHRTYLNTPRPSGACGGAAWSRYRLDVNGEQALEFHMGCSDTFVIADHNNIQMCAFGLGEGCRVYRGDALRLNRLGDWISEKVQ